MSDSVSVPFPRRAIGLALISTAALALAGAGASMARAQASGGTATYWMIADTASGMGMMAGGGGGAAAMRSMMMGGGAGAGHAYNLRLELGTSRKPAGEPSAEHVPPAGLRAGASLPLVTPRSAPPADWRHNMEKPKGRLLIYWGCGDKARPGQPVVLDFAAMMAGKMPPAFASVNTYSPPSAGRHTTYGEWPNARSQTHVPAGGSLVGEHLVRGNYTPDIKFSLTQGQDFMAPVRVSGNEAGPGGAVPLAWQPVTGSKAWFASTMGAAENGDMIMWSSSESQAMPMMMSHMSPGEISRLVQSKVLLPATATRCTVPAEVARASQSAMLMVTAFGSEYNFSHPARPANAPASWRPDWTVKVLTKSTYSGILGMDMSEMFGGRQSMQGMEEDEEETPRRRRRPGLPGLGSIFGQ